MVETTYTREELLAQEQTNLDIRNLVGLTGEQDFYDRANYIGNQAQEIVDVFGSFQPAVRADMYTLWRSTLMIDGLSSLQDHEILLLSFAPRDGGAEEAAKMGESSFGYQWYQDNITMEDDAGYGGPLRQLIEADPDITSRGDDLVRLMEFEEQARGVDEPSPIADVGDTMERYAVNTFGGIAAGTAILAGAAMVGTAGVALVTSPAVVTGAGAVAPVVKPVYDATKWSIDKLIAGAQSQVQATASSMFGTSPVTTSGIKDIFTYLQLRTGQPLQAAAQKLIPLAGKTPMVGPWVADRLGEVGAYGGASGTWRLLAAGGILSASTIDSWLHPEEVAEAQADRPEEEESGVQPRKALSKVGLNDYERLNAEFAEMEQEIEQTVQVAEVRTAEATDLKALMAAHTEYAAGRTGATEIADPTQDDYLDVLTGQQNAGDFNLGGDPESILSEAAFSAFRDAHWYDPAIDGTPDEVAAAGFVLHEDVTSLDEFGMMRKIVLPQSMEAGGAVRAYEERRLNLAEEISSQTPNPYIGVPEDFVSRQYAPIEGMDQYEARFIAGVGGAGGDPYQEVDPRAPLYRESNIYDAVVSLSPVQVFKMQTLARDALQYSDDRPTLPGHLSTEDTQIIAQAMDIANKSTEQGMTWWRVMEDMATQGREWRAEDDAARSTASAAVRAPFSVPVSLRSIPGEKTIAEEAKARFEQKLGRAARPDELAGIANELTGYHTTSNQEEIALYLAAYNGDNQGLLTGAQMERIEDPGAATSFDISDRWANEIDLNKRRETNSQSFSRMLSATMGNRPSVGNLTAAGGVTQIGRQ